LSPPILGKRAPLIRYEPKEAPPDHDSGRERAMEVLARIHELLSEHFGVPAEDVRLYARFIEELEIDPST